MRVQRLHHDGEPMVAKVQVVLEQMKEYQRQEEVRANEIFVGRDRDIQLIFGLLGIQSSDTDLTSEDKAIIQKYHRIVKGNARPSIRTSQGPVVQSVVSLTSSLRVISLTVVADSINNILIFFAEKM